MRLAELICLLKEISLACCITTRASVCSTIVSDGRAPPRLANHRHIDTLGMELIAHLTFREQCNASGMKTAAAFA